MKSEKINSLALCSLIPFFTSSAFMGSGFLFLFHNTNKSALISMCIGFIISIIFNIIIFKFFNTYPEDTFLKKMKKAFPKFIYYIFILIIFAFLLLMGGTILYRLVTFFGTQFLTDMPPVFLSLFLGILVFYLASNNIEVITRFSVISLLIAISVFIFNVLSLSPYIEITNLFPIIDTSTSKIALSSLISSLLFSGPSFLLFIIPKNNIVDKEKIKKYSIIFYILSAFILLIICIMTLSCLGIEIVNLYTYPVYIVLKKVHIFDFMNSVENITILFWFFHLIITSALTLMFAKNIFTESFNITKLKSKNISLLCITIISIVFPLVLFSNDSALDKPSLVLLPLVTYSIFIITSIIFLIFNTLKNRKTNKKIV